MDACTLFNELIAIHAKSLPVYLMDAAPRLTDKAAHAKDVLDIVAADHLMTVDRLAETVLERGGEVNQGAFPMSFTGLHDLSMDYLIELAVTCQADDTERIGEIANLLSNDARASALAQEAWGAAQGHLESLRELHHASVHA